MAVRARYTVSNFVHTLLLKHTHTFTVPIPPRFVSRAGLSLPSVSSCCCCSFLLSWENRGFFSLVSVFYRKYISASRYLVLVPSVIPVRPAGTPPLQPQLQELRQKQQKKHNPTVFVFKHFSPAVVMLHCILTISLFGGSDILELVMWRWNRTKCQFAITWPRLLPRCERKGRHKMSYNYAELLLNLIEFFWTGTQFGRQTGSPWSPSIFIFFFCFFPALAFHFFFPNL